MAQLVIQRVAGARGGESGVKKEKAEHASFGTKSFSGGRDFPLNEVHSFHFYTCLLF